MNTIAKMILPAAVFVLASAGAVSTQSDKDAALKKAVTTEWIKINNSSSNCQEVQVDCTTFNNGHLCTDDQNNQVFRLNSQDECSITLYKPD